MTFCLLLCNALCHLLDSAGRPPPHVTFLSNLQNCEVNRSLSFIFKVLQPWVFDNRLVQCLSVKTDLSEVGVL